MQLSHGFLFGSLKVQPEKDTLRLLLQRQSFHKNMHSKANAGGDGSICNATESSESYYFSHYSLLLKWSYASQPGLVSYKDNERDVKKYQRNESSVFY
jgi:hypothetical protein